MSTIALTIAALFTLAALVVTLNLSIQLARWLVGLHHRAVSRRYVRARLRELCRPEGR